jgi:hypothetical protein
MPTPALNSPKQKVDGEHIYWADTGKGLIGRANLDDTEVKEDFITPPAGEYEVEVEEGVSEKSRSQPPPPCRRR